MADYPKLHGLLNWCIDMMNGTFVAIAFHWGSGVSTGMCYGICAGSAVMLMSIRAIVKEKGN